MAASENKKIVDKATGAYEITWPAKPLGFSIVMDTTGNNAYVSSIQKPKNVEWGLKLAAQIIAVNGWDARNQKHAAILNKIKSTTAPIVLRFQPRSFANNDDQNDAIAVLEFSGAKQNQKRINGYFHLVTKKNANSADNKYIPKERINGKPVWKRKSTPEELADAENKASVEADPIYCWFWPAESETNKLGTDKAGVSLWMISRGSQINVGGAYACYETKSKDMLSQCYGAWKTYDAKKGDFVETEIKIEQSSVG